MPGQVWDDYRWLVSAEAAPWLQRAAQQQGSLVQRTAALRKELSPQRAALVLEQLELRRRAADKFAAAEQMFFTDKSYQQATDEHVAQYKASRFPQNVQLADLCCGCGGDLIALAGRGPVVGVDRDQRMCLIAAANHRVQGAAPQYAVETLAADVDDGAACRDLLASVAAWHIDPDRRPQGRRTTRAELHDPDDRTIDALRAVNPHAAVKLAPAAAIATSWQHDAELEWIGRGGQCRQLVAWFGNLAQRPGARQATLLSKSTDGRTATCHVAGEPGIQPTVASQLGRYLFEPDATVLAADLHGALASQLGLMAVDAGVAYLTGDALPPDMPALACFAIEEVLPLDLKRVKALLRSRGIGRLEVKKRGVPHDPAQLQQQLKVPGEESATLIVTPHAAAVMAVVARRVAITEGDEG